MKAHVFRAPPATARRRATERTIVRAMVLRTGTVYVLFAASLALLARPAWQAVLAGNDLTIAIVVLGVAFAYLLAGGGLCALYIAQLDRWPPPGAPCRFGGVGFVYTWLWSAPGILTDLALGARHGLRV